MSEHPSARLASVSKADSDKSPLQSLQHCVQMVIDSQPMYMQYALRMLWQAANTDPLTDFMTERAWMNHRRFLAMLADHHDFLEPALSSLPDPDYVGSSGTALKGYGLVFGDLNSPDLTPYLQELNALESALRDLLP
ncbi:TPA: hypothetical protein OB598_004469 [Escherichia coli]|nr:hypothetical protein [Escherichia coli]